MREAWARCLKYLPEDRTNRYLVVTVVVSVLLHVLVGLLLMGGNMEQRIISKRGESLLVDIAPDKPKETAPLGNPSRPVGPDTPAPPRQPAPPAPKVAPIPPTPPAAAPAPAPRPAPPTPKVADTPKEAPKAPPAQPAPPKSEEPGPPSKVAPPAPPPRADADGESDVAPIIRASATARCPHAASRGLDAA